MKSSVHVLSNLTVPNCINIILHYIKKKTLSKFVTMNQYHILIKSVSTFYKTLKRNEKNVQIKTIFQLENTHINYYSRTIFYVHCYYNSKFFQYNLLNTMPRYIVIMPSIMICVM